MSTMKVKQIAGALGAEISGVDLSKGVPASLAADIRKVFLEHQVIFLHDQNLTPQQFLAFAEAMGEPIEYPFVKGLDSFAHIIEVKKLEHEKVNFGGIWHSDTTYLDVPPWALCCSRVKYRLTVATPCLPASTRPMRRYRAP